MANPIIQMMGKNNPINHLMNMMSGKNPDVMFNQLMRTNPQFAQFVNANRGKSPEQIAHENGIDINVLKQFMK